MIYFQPNSIGSDYFKSVLVLVRYFVNFSGKHHFSYVDKGNLSEGSKRKK